MANTNNDFLYGEKTVVQNGRASFCHVFKPAKDRQGKLKYFTTLIFPKSGNHLAKLKVEIANVINEKFPQGVPAIFDLPIKDGDLPNGAGKVYEENKGSWIIKVKVGENSKPGLLDMNKQDVISNDVIYSGCYLHVSTTPFYYPSINGGKPGIGLVLNNVMKAADGEKLSGGGDANSDFDAIKPAEYSGESELWEEENDKVKALLG